MKIGIICKAARRTAVAALAFAMATTSALDPVQAQRGGIRDAEIEALIYDYSAPILKAAGLGGQNIRIHLINDQSFNAFVVDGNNMFLHVGAIMKSQTPNQVIGVLAHEAGHIAGSHIARMHVQVARAQQAALFFQLLGIAAMAGGALGGGGDDLAQGGAAILQGGQTAVGRSFLMYRRSEESAADQAALKYLNATKQSASGMIETFRLFAEQSLGGRSIDPYVQSHPMPQDRIAQLIEAARASPYFDRRDAPELQLRHDMARAKLFAFLNRTNYAKVVASYPETNQGLPALYARAIATCYAKGARAAVPIIDRLIAAMPANPYFHEFKGQCILEEGGDPAQAVAPLREAVRLAPRAHLIRILLAQALLANDGQALVNEAVKHLRVIVDAEKPLNYERKTAAAYDLLAKAYARINRQAEAELAQAIAYRIRGRFRDAKEQATRAQAGLPFGSPGWREADDIINMQIPKL